LKTAYGGTDHRRVEGCHGRGQRLGPVSETRDLGCDVLYVTDEICRPGNRPREETAPNGSRKPAIEADGGGAGAEGDHANTGKAQGETNCRHAAGGTLWAQSATGVSVSRVGPEHAAIPKLVIRRSGAQGEDTRDRRDHAMLRLLSDIREAATGRLKGESPEG
jgi:hypothetical protein